MKEKSEKTDLTDVKRREIAAQYITSSSVANAKIIQNFNNEFESIGKESGIGLIDLCKELNGTYEKLRDNDFSDIEEMLFYQAQSLQSIFVRMSVEMAQAKLVNQVQVFGQIALKAQNQARQTLSALAAIKNPQSATFVKQQNNAQNMQVVNNQDKSENPKFFENSANELLSESENATLDLRGTQTAGIINTKLETLEPIERSQKWIRRRGFQNERIKAWRALCGD